MTAFAERETSAATSGYPMCDVCGTADVLQLGSCASCSGGEADALLFVERSERRADREGLEAWLIDSFAGTVGASDAREAAEGLRPIVGLPTATAGRAAAALSMRGVSAVAVSRSEAWKRLPRGLLALAGAAVGMGLFLGLTVNPAMFFLGPAFGTLLIVAASRQARAPIWTPEASVVFELPAAAETRVRGTLASLPKGRARARLMDLVAVANGLVANRHVRSSQDLVDATSELLSLSCRAAVDLDRLGRSVAVLEKTPLEEKDPELAEVMADAVVARDALIERLDEVLTTLVRVQTATSGDATELKRAARRLADEIGLRTQAWQEVERYTA